MAMYELSGRIVGQIDLGGRNAVSPQAVYDNIQKLSGDLHRIVVGESKPSGGGGGGTSSSDPSCIITKEQLQTEVMNVISVNYSDVANLLDNGQIDAELSIVGGNADN